jgi:hypothetical protein
MRLIVLAVFLLLLAQLSTAITLDVTSPYGDVNAHVVFFSGEETEECRGSSDFFLDVSLKNFHHDTNFEIGEFWIEPEIKETQELIDDCNFKPIIIPTIQLNEPIKDKLDLELDSKVTVKFKGMLPGYWLSYYTEFKNSGWNGRIEDQDISDPDCLEEDLTEREILVSSSFDQPYYWDLDSPSTHCTFVFKTPPLKNGDVIEVKGRKLFLNGSEAELINENPISNFNTECGEDYKGDIVQTIRLHITSPHRELRGRYHQYYHNDDQNIHVTVHSDKTDNIADWEIPIYENVNSMSISFYTFADDWSDDFNAWIELPRIGLKAPFKDEYSINLDTMFLLEAHHPGQAFPKYSIEQTDIIEEKRHYDKLWLRHNRSHAIDLTYEAGWNWECEPELQKQKEVFLTSSQAKEKLLAVSERNREERCDEYFHIFDVSDLAHNDVLEFKEGKLLLNGKEVEKHVITDSPCTCDYVKPLIPDENIPEEPITLEGLFPVKDTDCNNGWPAGEGESVIVSYKKTCDLFEVTKSEMLQPVREALECCSAEKPDDSLCRAAWEDRDSINSNDGVKRCMGLYIIHGMGNFAEWVQGYYWPERNCEKRIFLESFQSCYNKDRFELKDEIIELLGEEYKEYPQVVDGLECKEIRKNKKINSWNSDTDMSENSCYFDYVPAHVTLNYIRSGTCADYSILATTLVRLAGYEKDEIFSAENEIHLYNIIKLPFDDKFTFFDTVGNRSVNIKTEDTLGTYLDGKVNYCDFWALYNDSISIRNFDNDALLETGQFTGEIYGCG